ncbi:hypothetical protein HOD20_07435 [archaeon]|jgi:hypothetical protein|nr:hypothetical protein [archaeon]MBT4352339.1 hypothetical protein [archaeon]MBT4647091.1 hypothetical protein [archaeon]MBT6821000.1 hypothetical protein [archaeon]MBT7392677.1 hypothetical protein [archaeon]
MRNKKGQFKIWFWFAIIFGIGIGFLILKGFDNNEQDIPVEIDNPQEFETPKSCPCTWTREVEVDGEIKPITFYYKLDWVICQPDGNLYSCAKTGWKKWIPFNTISKIPTTCSIVPGFSETLPVLRNIDICADKSKEFQQDYNFCKSILDANEEGEIKYSQWNYKQFPFLERHLIGQCSPVIKDTTRTVAIDKYHKNFGEVNFPESKCIWPLTSGEDKYYCYKEGDKICTNNAGNVGRLLECNPKNNEETIWKSLGTSQACTTYCIDVLDNYDDDKYIFSTIKKNKNVDYDNFVFVDESKNKKIMDRNEWEKEPLVIFDSTKNPENDEDNDNLPDYWEEIMGLDYSKKSGLGSQGGGGGRGEIGSEKALEGDQYNNLEELLLGLNPLIPERNNIKFFINNKDDNYCDSTVGFKDALIQQPCGCAEKINGDVYYFKEQENICRLPKPNEFDYEGYDMKTNYLFRCNNGLWDITSINCNDIIQTGKDETLPYDFVEICGYFKKTRDTPNKKPSHCSYDVEIDGLQGAGVGIT